TPDAGVPRAGVTSVGEVAKTSAPLPVSSDTLPATWAEVVAAKTERLSVLEATTLVSIASELPVFVSPEPAVMMPALLN
ncbi:hypothetical protein U2075_14840, partial [Listeria monocytogenes]|uniref:hypothetical protein n=1 Tax=Listeria monocytogenes TaxID=1639 RepID=UPI002FDC0D64